MIINITLYLIMAISFLIFWIHLKDSDIGGVIFLSIFIACILILIYRSSNSIEVSALGNAEKFGQFGDYLGGVLNPIFGFFTVLLLISSLRVQSKELTHSKIVTNAERVERLLESQKSAFKALISKTSFRCGMSNQMIYPPFTLDHFNALRDNSSNDYQNTISKTIKELRNHSKKLEFPEMLVTEAQGLDIESVNNFNNIRTSLNEIVELFNILINPDEDLAINTIYLRKLDDVLFEAMTMGVIDNHEYHFKTDIIIDRLVKRDRLFPTIPRIQKRTLPTKNPNLHE